tara:strand:- start:3700 stop:4152 length:453 start_codon:yes stop_codon:yes gene_type:complete
LPKKNITKKFYYSLELIESLILDIDSYKDFLPWCTNSKVISKKQNKDSIVITADLEIGYLFAKDVYTSHVKYDTKTKKIIVNAIDGPLKTLENIWTLKKINENECDVKFFINLELKNIILNKMLDKMFDIGFKKILNSFEQRAKFLANLN